MKRVGFVKRAFGNLLHVEFAESVYQGEIAFIQIGDKISLKAEVIEVKGNEAKLQVFEDTSGVKLGSLVEFSNDLLEAELGTRAAALTSRTPSVRKRSGYSQRSYCGSYMSAFIRSMMSALGRSCA